MKRVRVMLAAALAVVLLSSTAFGGLTFAVSNSELIYGHSYFTGEYDENNDPIYATANVLQVDIACTDLGTFDGQNVAAIGMGLEITGLGASHLTPLAAAMRLSADEWQAEGFDWDFSGSIASTADAYGSTAGDRLTFTYVVNSVGQTQDFSTLYGDVLVARFYYTWDSLGIGDWIAINAFADGDGEQPYQPVEKALLAHMVLCSS